jgi:hypothetical protein
MVGPPTNAISSPLIVSVDVPPPHQTKYATVTTKSISICDGSRSIWRAGLKSDIHVYVRVVVIYSGPNTPGFEVLNSYP